MGTPNDIIFRHLPEDLAGYYDHESGRIYIDPCRPVGTTRATLVHERIHKNLDHKPLAGAAHNAREICVESLTAGRLINFQMLLDGLMRHTSLLDLAELWKVDVGLVVTRLGAITPLEHALIEVCGRYCIRGPVAPTDRSEAPNGQE